MIILMLMMPITISNEIFTLSFVGKQIAKSHENPLSKRELKCLVDNAFHEARGEGMVGMVLVTKVVLNRSKKTKENYCSTIYKKNQFSWTLMKNLKKIPNTTRKEIEYLVLTVHHGLADHLVPTHLSNALFYHADYVRPSWSKVYKKLGVWGNHVFYNER
jgi:spore germination cell wall hydrolase CwlJ-like protein